MDCQLKPDAAVTDSISLYPLSPSAEYHCHELCRSLESNHISAIFKCDLPTPSAGSTLHETLAAFLKHKFFCSFCSKEHQPTLICILITQALINAYVPGSDLLTELSQTPLAHSPLLALLLPASHHSALSETMSPDLTIAHLSILGTAYWQHSQN